MIARPSIYEWRGIFPNYQRLKRLLRGNISFSILCKEGGDWYLFLYSRFLWFQSNLREDLDFEAHQDHYSESIFIEGTYIIITKRACNNRPLHKTISWFWNCICNYIGLYQHFMYVCMLCPCFITRTMCPLQHVNLYSVLKL